MSFTKQIADFYQRVGVRWLQYPELRKGQVVFNLMMERRPWAARALRSTDVDPYYHDDRVDQFVTKCFQLLSPAEKLAWALPVLQLLCQYAAAAGREASSDSEITPTELELLELAETHAHYLADLSQFLKELSNRLDDLGVDSVVDRLVQDRPSDDRDPLVTGLRHQIALAAMSPDQWGRDPKKAPFEVVQSVTALPAYAHDWEWAVACANEFQRVYMPARGDQ